MIRDTISGTGKTTVEETRNIFKRIIGLDTMDMGDDMFFVLMNIFRCPY